MKILVLSAEYPPVIGGIGTYTLNLLRALKLAGHHPTLLTTVSAAPDFSEPLDLPVIRLKPGRDRKFIKMGPLLLASWRLCRQQRPDLIIAMSWTHEGLVAALLKQHLGIPFWVVTHGSEILRHRTHPLFAHLMRWSLALAQRLLSNSAYTRRLVQQFDPQLPPCEVVYPALETKTTPALPTDWLQQQNLSGRFLLTVARLSPRKGHREVIEALPALLRYFPDLLYAFTGRGDTLPELLSLAEERGVRHALRPLGFVSAEELAWLYAHCEIYVSPSLTEEGDVEGFGISLIEASLAGKPVIAGHSGGVPEAVIAGQTGLLIDASVPAELVGALQRLLRDSSYAQELGRAGRARVLAELSLEAKARRLQQLLACP